MKINLPPLCPFQMYWMINCESSSHGLKSKADFSISRYAVSFLNGLSLVSTPHYKESVVWMCTCAHTLTTAIHVSMMCLASRRKPVGRSNTFPSGTPWRIVKGQINDHQRNDSISIASNNQYPLFKMPLMNVHDEHSSMTVLQKGF